MKKISLGLIIISILLSFTSCSKNEIEYGVLNKVGDKLYEVTFDEYVGNYKAANEYYTNEYLSSECTCIYKDGILMRNLDWYLKANGKDVCETIIRTTANEGRYATIGVINNFMVTDDTYNKLTEEQLKLLPFALADGMNSEGLMFGQNSCPNIDGVSITTGTNPNGEDLTFLLIGREVLDYCASVDEAIDFLKSKNCICPKSGEGHLLFADKNRAVVIEFVDNQIVVLEQEDLPYEQMFCTNHYLYNGEVDSGHGSGFERDEIIKENYDSIIDWQSGMDLLEKVKYSNSYTIPLGEKFWYSEYYTKVEYGGITYDFNPNTPKDDPTFLYIISEEIAAYERKEDNTWRTSHSSVYDCLNQTLHLTIREDYTKVYNFSLLVK